MNERQKILLEAVEGMTIQFPFYCDEDVVSHLLCDEGLPEREKILLGALVEMVDQCLQPYENGPIRYDDGVDTLAQSAGEHAVFALAEFGLMNRVSVRLGRWTPAGKAFLAEGMREWKQWRDKLRIDAEVAQREIELKARIERRARQVRWAKYALFAGSIAAGSVLAVWIAIFSLKLF